MKVGDLVKHNKPLSRYEFDQIGLVLEVQEDWMKNWSKVKVLWNGEESPLWLPVGTIKPFTAS